MRSLPVESHGKRVHHHVKKKFKKRKRNKYRISSVTVEHDVGKTKCNDCDVNRKRHKLKIFSVSDEYDVGKAKFNDFGINEATHKLKTFSFTVKNDFGKTKHNECDINWEKHNLWTSSVSSIHDVCKIEKDCYTDSDTTFRKTVFTNLTAERNPDEISHTEEQSICYLKGNINKFDYNEIHNTNTVLLRKLKAYFSSRTSQSSVELVDHEIEILKDFANIHYGQAADHYQEICIYFTNDHTNSGRENDRTASSQPISDGNAASEQNEDDNIVSLGLRHIQQQGILDLDLLTGPMICIHDAAAVQQQQNGWQGGQNNQGNHADPQLAMGPFIYLHHDRGQPDRRRALPPRPLNIHGNQLNQLNQLYPVGVGDPEQQDFYNIPPNQMVTLHSNMAEESNQRYQPSDLAIPRRESDCFHMGPFEPRNYIGHCFRCPLSAEIWCCHHKTACCEQHHFHMPPNG